MTLNTVLTACFIAIAFASWPVLGKFSGASGGWVGTIVVTGTAAVVTLLSAKHIAGTSLPLGKICLLLLLAATLNGVGCHLYAMKIADLSVPTGAFVVVVSILMIVVSSLLDWALNGVVPRLRDIGGYGTAMLTVCLFGRF